MINLSILQGTKPIYKLLSFFLIFIGFSIIIPIFLMLVGITIWGKEVVLNMGSNQASLSYLIYFQLFTQIGVFAGVALFFARMNTSAVFDFLKFKSVKWGGFLFLSIIAIVAVIPLSSWLMQVSLAFPYPDSMKEFIEILKKLEDGGNNLMTRFLSIEGWSGLIFNLFFLALIPALCEELLFRGALMNVLQQLMKNKHLVVILSAILFSAMHMQFFGFLSRFVLGLILGYATLYSGSLFPSIAAHFTNNALSVIGFYLSDKKDLNEVGSIDNYWVLGLTVLVAIFTVVVMRQKSLKYEIPL
jgi:hypothetical protein